MQLSPKRWVLSLLTTAALLLSLCAALVYWVDPCFTFRWPSHLPPVFFNERYQNAGMAKNGNADIVLMGTSMTANYRVSQVERAFGGTAVKLTFPDGYLSEFDAALAMATRAKEPKRVIFGLDINVLTRDESEKTDALPAYLYNQNPVDDVKYLLNKDSLYYSLYQIKSDLWGTAEPVDEAFTWDDTVWWAKETALAGYERPPLADSPVAQDAYLTQVTQNIDCVLDWARAHPQTEFDVFFPPYSILYWDKMQRTGATDAVFSALQSALHGLVGGGEAAQPPGNIRVYFFPAQLDIITDLDNYGDYIHHSGGVCTRLLGELQAGDYQVTADNLEETLKTLRDFVEGYDYGAIWG
ncbi:MAG: hypothetical protein RRY95_07030 [Oscillospiraceae bacterium]